MGEAVFEGDKFAAMLGIVQDGPAPCDGGSAVVMPLEEKHENRRKAAHGGAIFTLSDMAFAAACKGLGISAVTSQSSISFLSSGHVGPLRAEASPVRLGKHLVVFDVMVYDGKNRPVAKAVMTGFVIGPLAVELEEEKAMEQNHDE